LWNSHSGEKHCTLPFLIILGCLLENPGLSAIGLQPLWSNPTCATGLLNFVSQNTLSNRMLHILTDPLISIQEKHKFTVIEVAEKVPWLPRMPLHMVL
jgi:hypothetical protein